MDMRDLGQYRLPVPAGFPGGESAPSTAPLHPAVNEGAAMPALPPDRQVVIAAEAGSPEAA